MIWLFIVAVAAAYITMVVLGLAALSSGHGLSTGLRMLIFVSAFVLAAYFLGVLPV